MDSTSSAMLPFIALCMLSFACKSWAGKTDFPFSEYTQFYSFKARTGEEVHSVSEPLPAYLLPQDPYFSVNEKHLQPPLDACSGPNLKDEQLREIWNAIPDAADGIFDGFPEAFRLAHQATIWGIPSVQIASAFTKSALNKTSPFPTLSINAVVNYPDPLDGSRPPQAGAQDVNFLYSLAWIDLTGGPLVITAPDTGGRFYELQFVDVYNETPLLIGPLLSPLGTGLTGPLRYVLAPYGYNDTIPDGYNHTAIMNSNTLWMIGRLAIKAGNIPDLADAQAAQAGFKIEPLFPKTYKKPFALAARDLYRRGVVAMVTPYRLWGADKGPYVTTEDFYPENSPPPIYKNASAFWELLGAITAINPPRDTPQADLYDSFAPLGLSLRGFGFDPNNLTTGTLGGMSAGLAAALGCVAYTAQMKQQASVTSTRWEPLQGSTSYGNDYLERAEAAITALGTNPESVSLSYLSRLATDRDNWGPGRPLDGSLYNYTLSFSQAPSVTTSWSLTPYARNGSLITDIPYDADSGLHRYSITDTTPGFNTKSGSLMVFMSATPPQYGTLQYSNWLPICRGPFYLVLRLYGPSKLAQEGNYAPPPVYAFEGPPAFTSTIAEVASLTNVLWVPQPAPSP